MTDIDFAKPQKQVRENEAGKGAGRDGCTKEEIG